MVCVVTGFCTVQVQRLQASKYCIISLTSDVELAIETGAVTSALVSYPDPSAHLVWEGGALQYSDASGPWPLEWTCLEFLTPAGLLGVITLPCCRMCQEQLEI